VLLEGLGEEGKKVAQSIVSVAGVKLNEESKLVLAFTEIFTRVVLFPARSVAAAADPSARRVAEGRRARINVAALKALNTLRRQGRMILVFPTGTRYRPWDPSTGKGLREIDSYLKFYSHMVTIAINGNTLVPNPNGKMDEDYPRKDVMIYTVSPVMKCSDFRREAVKGREPHEDVKQHVVNRLMAALSALHEETEKKRLPLLPAGGQA
jgi:glycerol-3-phosphate O-acyltransferase